MAQAYSHRDYNRNITILRVSKNGMPLAQEISHDTPIEALEYAETIRNGSGEIYTQHQQDKINELQQQLLKKEEDKKPGLKNLIAYYYNR